MNRYQEMHSGARVTVRHLMLWIGAGVLPLLVPSNHLATGAEPGTPVAVTDSIQIEGTLHFSAPDGNDVVVTPGTYRVERASESRLKLAPAGSQPAIEVHAGSDTHEESLAVPTALLIAEEDQDDEVHIVLLLPDQASLDAIGVISGMRSRGSMFLSKRQKQFAMTLATQPAAQPTASAKPSTMPSPLVRVPSDAAAAVIQRPSAQAAQVREDTGVVSVTAGPPSPVAWGYLRMHAPDQIVSMLKKVQTGGMRAGALEGLANPERIQSLLAVPYPDQPAVMSRGLGLVGPPSSASPYMAQPRPSSPVQPPVTPMPPPGVIVGPPSQTSPILTQPLPASPVQPPATTSPLPGGMTGPPSETSKTLMRSDWSSLIAQPFDPAKLGGAVAPVKADVSPRQVDFGNIWEGQVPRAEIRIVVPKDGGLTISLARNRPFRIVKASTASGLLKLVRTTPAHALMVEQEPTDSRTQPPWNFGARAGQDLWVVIEFAPRADLFAGDSAGQYQTTVNVDGYQWTASIPVMGYFNGVKIGVIPILESHDVHVINPLHHNPNQCAVQIPQRLTLLNAGQSPQAVVVEPAVFPGNFSMQPISVTVPAGGTLQVALPITLHCLSDMWSREFDLTIKITYPGQKRQTGFTLIIYPYMYRIVRDGTLGSCKYSTEFWTYPNGNFHLTVTASTSALLPQGFDYAYFFRGTKVAGLELYLDGQILLGTGVQKSYGFRQPGLEANYMQLFAEGKPDIRLRCYSK